MNVRNGRVTAVVGPMGSGKSKALVALFHQFMAAGKKVIAFQHADGARGVDKHKIAARDGTYCPCLPVMSLAEIAHDDFVQTCDIVMVDEIQLFTDKDLGVILEAMAMVGVDVWLFGLDVTSDNKTFGQIGTVLAHADEVLKLKIQCGKCGSVARVSNYKHGDKDGDIKIGDLDDYEPLCRDCYYGNFSTMLDPESNIHSIIQQTLSDGGEGVEMAHITASAEKDGITIDMWVPMQELNDAGYTIEDVNDIYSMEGIQRLMEDLGYALVEIPEDGYEEEDE
jgi:thymidine kinase